MKVPLGPIPLPNQAQYLAYNKHSIYQLKEYIQFMECKPTSYQDLLKHFRQAEQQAPLPRCQKQQQPTPQKLVYRPMHLKRANQHNKQNLTTKSHTQSVYEKNSTHRSIWTEADVLKQYNEKRKQKQLELTYNKFINYITNVLVSLTGIVPPDLLTHKITYLQYLAALKQISLIKDNYEPAPSDSVSSLWHDLTPHSHTCGAFILYIASILNIRRTDQQDSKYSYLANKYAELRYTRMEMQGKVRTQQQEEEFPFTPCISQRSRTLAGSRSKSKNRRSKNCLAQQSLLEESVDQLLEPYSPIDIQAGNKRSQILYKLAKERSLEKKRDKKSNEVQYEKSIQELTFHPKIHSNCHRKPKKTIQGQQDSINRMIRGRVEREVRKIIHDKGLPYNQKLFEKMKRQRYEALQKHRKSHASHPSQRLQNDIQHHVTQQQEPGLQQMPTRPAEQKADPIVLTIEVDENRCQKLVIEDPSQYKEAAAKFIQDLNLKAEMYDKLIEGVEKALKFQLTQVDQDSCQSEYDSIS